MPPSVKPPFPYPALGPATNHARRRAQEQGRPWYVVERVRFAAFERAALALLLVEDLYRDDELTVVRIVHPDGRVEDLNDPGTKEGRLGAFCQLTDAERDAVWALRFGPGDQEPVPARMGQAVNQVQVDEYDAVFRQLVALAEQAQHLSGKVPPEAMAGAISDRWAADETTVLTFLTWIHRVLLARR